MSIAEIIVVVSVILAISDESTISRCGSSEESEATFALSWSKAKQYPRVNKTYKFHWLFDTGIIQTRRRHVSTEQRTYGWCTHWTLRDFRTRSWTCTHEAYKALLCGTWRLSHDKKRKLLCDSTIAIAEIRVVHLLRPITAMVQATAACQGHFGKRSITLRWTL